MNKYFQTLTNSRGDVLPGDRLQVATSAGAVVDIFADDNGTQFTDSNGDPVKYATSDLAGLVEFYWEPEEGQVLQWLDTNGELRKAFTDFARPFLIGSFGGDLPQNRVADLEDDLATKATRGDIAALVTDTAKARPQYLTEAGREGLFVWTTGDLSAMVTADTQQGIYVPPASDTTGATGAWVRQLPTPNYWHTDWFGIPGDDGAGSGAVTSHVEMTAMVNLANLVKPSRIMFGSKIYTFTAAIPEWNFQVELYGARGVQGTIINKRYDEASATRGILASNDHGFTIDKITIVATSGSGGSGVSAILTEVSPANGRTYLIDTYISVGQYCNHSLYVNGMTNTTGSGPGYRGLWIRGGEYFGAAVSAIHIEGAHHVFATGVFLTRTGVGTTSQIALDTDGDAEVYNDDWQWHGMISGVANLNWFGGGNNADGTPGNNGGRSLFCSPQVLGINVDANCTATMWTGPKIPGGGAVTNNAGSGFVFTYAGTVVDSSNNVTSGYIIYGNGKIFQWGTVTTVAGEALANVLPVAFTSSNIQYGAQPTTMPASNLVSVANVVKTAASPLTQYDIRAGNLNISSGAVAANAAPWRWTANGQ